MGKSTRKNWGFIHSEAQPGGEIGGYHIHSKVYTLTGSGKPVLLFILHGNDGVNWKKGKGFTAMYTTNTDQGNLAKLTTRKTVRATLCRALNILSEK